VGSGIIFLAIVGAWAAYFLPAALRRYDQAARNRSIERFSSAMRVLGGGKVAAADVRPTGDAADGTATREPAAAPEVHRRAQRTAARVAARRRRATMAVLVVLGLAVGGVAGYGLLPWWSGVAPAGLVLGFLVACRIQVRRESDAYWRAAAETEAPVRRDVAVVVEPEDEPAVVLDQAEMSRVAVALETADGVTLWDPVPVTLPTYVSKAKAPRTIRTIELGQTGTEGSSRTDAPAAMVEPGPARSGRQEAAAETVEEPAQAVNG
jgi:hypothetical protein